MAGVKITEKATVDSVKNAASILITQQETVGGETKESVRRASIAALVAALRANGVNTGTVTETALENMYPYLVNDVSPTASGIDVTFWDGSVQHIDIESGGLAFDEISYDAENHYLHIRQDGEDVIDPCFIPGGGGGGSTSGTVVELANLNGSASITTAFGSTVNIQFSFFDKDSGGDYTNSTGALELSVNGQVFVSKSIEQGNHSENITPFLSEGINKIKVKVTDEDDNYATKTWTVNAVSLSVSSSFDATQINTGAVIFRYTPIGNDIEKTIHFEIDDEDVATATVTASNRQQAQTIPAQTHGAHRLRVYATATVSGVSVTSNILVYDVIWAVAGNNTPIIACGFTGSATQFSTVSIPFMVYDPDGLTTTIVQKVNGATVSTQTVGRTLQTWSYRPDTVGTDTLTITCGTTVKTISLVVASSGVNISPVTTGLVVDLNPQGHTNSEQNRTSFGYTDGDGENHPLTFSANFDWNNGGFKTDASGNTYLCVKAGTTVTLDRSLFNDDAMRTGKEIKMIFKATNCRDYDAQIASCLSGGIGLTLNAQNATLKSELTTMNVQYCEDSLIEMDVNIESDTESKAAIVWLEGVPARVAIYADNDNWTQSTPSNLVIGSADCDVWIYRLKAYDTSLTRNEIHENWIADAPDAEEMFNRFTRNNIFDANGKIDIQKLINANPNLRVIELTAERMTTGKKDPVACTVKHTYKAGGNAHTFTATGAVFKVQGTSSAAYGEAAYNWDVDFKNATSWTDGNGNDLKSTGYAMTANSIPVNYFCIKLNVASSECANNAVLQGEYNDFQPYKNPARLASSKVRDTMEGHPCVTFFTNGSSETLQIGAVTLAPGETMLYGCGDMMNSKKNLAVFGQDGTNPNQMCIEISNNTNNQCLFKSDDLTTEAWDGDSSFEFRYPEEPTAAMKAAFQRVLSWVVSTDTTAATGRSLAQSVTYAGVAYTHDTAQYRAAKFKAEYTQYFIKDALLYHYLFTERHMMVDNRAKNCFISTDDGIHWEFTKDYDNDTADGNDNEGGLTLSYGLEDTDTIGQKSVFNASDSVLWKNVRDLLFDELQAAFITLENAGAWSAERILARFTEHQSARPEALLIEDMWKKYILTYTVLGVDSYLDMMLGTKADQRRQFEIYQEKYCASKYRSSKATSDAITFRAYTPTEWGGIEPGQTITITPYADMYINITSGSGMARQRAKRGTEYEIECPIDTLNDTEIYIYSASNISDVGDLAPLYVGYFNIAAATKLTKLKLGDGTEGYSNTNAASITVGNNVLLEEIDIRNCPNIAQALDLTGCAALTELYAEGSGITGVSFAPGGNIETAHIPNVASISVIDLKHLDDLTVSAYTNLRTLRWENCDTVDVLDIIEAATGITRLRVLGIDWELDDTTLLDQLLALRGLDAQNHNVDQSVLGGSASVPIMRQSKLSAYNAAWSDLTVTYTTLVQQYLVKFVNYDNTTLYSAYVDRGSDATDPVTSGAIQTPTRPSTASATYTYNGWQESLSSIIGPTTIHAKYAETARKYTVKWYNGSTLLQTTQVNYGEEAVYSGNTPVNASEEALYIYRLFSGWDKSTGCVTEDINVYATYQVGELPTAGTDISAMTPAQIYGVIASGNSNNYFTVKDQLKITLGFEPAYSNVQYVDLIDNPLVMKGDTYIDTEIAPFANGNADGWTLVADMEYTANTAGQTMICCMQENGFMGFKAYYNNGPCMQWSTGSKKSTNTTTQREIMVMRHAPGSKNVTVYFADAYSNAVGFQDLTKTIDTTTEKHIYIGCNVDDSGNKSDYATGILYSARFWKGDLGDAVCKQICCWPRETYDYEVAGTQTYYQAGSSTKSGLDLICASLLERTHKMNDTNTNDGGYEASAMNIWMGLRFDKALPIVFQSMLQQISVMSNHYVDGTQYNDIRSCAVYSHIPSIAEMSNRSDEPWIYEGRWIPYFTNDASRIAYLRINPRENAVTFTQSTDPTLLTSNNVQYGDVWCNTADSNKYYIWDGLRWYLRTAYTYWCRGAAVTYATYFSNISNSGTVYTGGSTATLSYGVRPRFSIGPKAA